MKKIRAKLGVAGISLLLLGCEEPPSPAPVVVDDPMKPCQDVLYDLESWNSNGTEKCSPKHKWSESFNGPKGRTLHCHCDDRPSK